jgi:hypothetical protein
MRVEDSFLFAHTANAFHDQVLRTASWILVVEFAGACVAAYLAWKKRAGGSARIVLTAMLPFILLLQLPASEVIWKYAPHLKFLQFPWRWLMALSVAGCALAGIAVVRQARWRVVLAGMMIAAMAIGSSLLFFQPCDDEDAVTAQLAGFRLGQGTGGTDEYTPVRVDNAAVQQHLPLVRVLRSAQDDTADDTPADNPEWRAGDPGSIAAQVDARRRNGEHWIVSVVTPETGYAVLRLMDYPSWRVTVDGQPVKSRPLREDGLMAVPVNAGSHVVEVQWAATRDVVAGRAVSAIALLALAVVAMRERKGRVHRRV